MTWFSKVVVSTFIITAALSTAAMADLVTFEAAGTGGDGRQLSASATFDYSSPGLLQVTLTNTATDLAVVPADVLTGVFFDINGGPALTPISAALDTGSTVVNASSQPAGGNVGGEWAYAQNLSGAPGNAGYGISSSGLGLFGQASFPGPNLADNTAVGGMSYGIISGIADNANPQLAGSKGKGKGKQGRPFIEDTVVFTFGIAGLDWEEFSLGDISNVSFQYGTSLTEPNIRTVVPEPASLALVALGLGGILWRRRKTTA